MYIQSSSIPYRLHTPLVFCLVLLSWMLKNTTRIDIIPLVQSQLVPLRTSSQIRTRGQETVLEPQESMHREVMRVTAICQSWPYSLDLLWG